MTMKISTFALCALLLILGQSCKKVNCYRCSSPRYTYNFCADGSDTTKLMYNLIANGGTITDEEGNNMSCTAYKK